MTKKHFYKTAILVSLTMLLLTSCKKYINLAPHDATYDQVFWTDGSNAESALGGAYFLLRKGLKGETDDHDVQRSYFIFGDLPTDGFWLSSNYWNFQSLLKDGKFTFSYAPYLGTLSDWSRFYRVINQCHLISENVPSIPAENFDDGESEKKQVIGEAYFLRAYTYFYMTKVWGDPVLTTASIKDPREVVPLPRSAEDVVLNYCIDNLKAAIVLLPFNKGTDNDKVRADKGAAWALLAQVYAWKHDYKNAELYCDSVINSGKYRLETIDNYQDIWKGYDAESIFELNMQYNAVNNEAGSYFFGDFLRDPYITGNTDSWEINTDLTQSIFPDTTVDKRFSKITAPASGARILIKYSNVDYYDPNSPTTYVVSNNLVLIRLADLYLLKAEALNEQGKTGEALMALNVIKQRAGLPAYTASQEEAKYEIMDERRREFIGEGCVAFDMIRTGTLLYYFSDVYTQERIDKKGYYWPLDMRTLLPQDVLLTQNPWWANH